MRTLSKSEKNQQFVLVGRRVETLDSLDKVFGRAKYTADIIPEDALHLKVLRSRIPHGRIMRMIIPQRPRKVRAFITAKDIPGVNSSSCIIPDRPLLAHGKVRCVADILGVAAAEDIDAAADFINSIDVKYEPLPVSSSPFEAMKPGAVMIHDKGNIVRHLRLENVTLRRVFGNQMQ